MKFFSRLVLCLISFSFLFVSCSRKTVSESDGKLKICATFHPLYVILLNLTEGVDDVELSMLAPADTGCLHDYQLTAKDMKAISACDILVACGGGMEDFMDKAISIKKDSIVSASDGFALVDENPHIWVSPEGAEHMTLNIAHGLCVLDPDNAQKYIHNSNDYIEKLHALKVAMHLQLDKFSGRRIITFHEAFPYFASEFNLEIAGVIEREPGTVPSSRELKEIISSIKDSCVSGSKPALFAEPQYSSSAAGIIARETGLKVYELDPAVTGKADRNSYIEAMQKNALVLSEALGED